MPTRTWTGAVNGNWNNNGNWVEGAFATSADDVVMGTITTAMTVNVSSACKSIDFTGYGSRALTMSNTLTCSGSYKQISTMTISGASGLIFNATATLTSAGVTFPNAITLQGTTITYTLADNWVINGTLTDGAAGVTTTLNGNQITCNGSFTQVGTAQAGSTLIILAGSGNWTVNAGTLSNPLTVNASGTYTFIGATLTYKTGTLTYTAGTLAGTIPALVITGSCTLNTAGIIWNNITANTASSTITFNSLLSGTGTFTISATTIFAGTAGFTYTNFTVATAGVSVTFVNAKTYTINGALVLTGTAASNITFVSASPGSQYNFVLTNNGTATLDVGFINCTDANSSAGLTIQNYPGSISNTTNWRLLGIPVTYSTGH